MLNRQPKIQVHKVYVCFSDPNIERQYTLACLAPTTNNLICYKCLAAKHWVQQSGKNKYEYVTLSERLTYLIKNKMHGVSDCLPLA